MGDLQRILDRGGPGEDDAIDRQMATNYPMSVSQYRYMQTLIHEGFSRDAARDRADRATRAELRPFQGKAWQERKAAGLAYWHTRKYR